MFEKVGSYGICSEKQREAWQLRLAKGSDVQGSNTLGITFIQFLINYMTGKVFIWLMGGLISSSLQFITFAMAISCRQNKP